MASGLVSDADGKVELKAAWKEGTIRIVETKVPAGYTQGDESEKTAKLQDGTVEFVNPKEKDPKPEPSATYEITYNLNGGEYDGSTEDIVEFYKEGETISIHEAPVRKGYRFDYWKGSEYQPGDSYTVTADHTFTAQWIKDTNATTTSSGSPKTGDGNTVALYIIIGGMAAAIFTFIAFKKKKVRAGIISMMLIGVFAIGTVYAADGYVINKIDDNGDPVEGAVFDIYGKPEVTCETTESVSINVGMTYRVYSGGKWSDVVETPQTVTVSGGSMTEKELSFTPGTAAQSVELPGAGTYTITMTGITKDDLKPESDLLALKDSSDNKPMPIIIDTVSATVSVDESGNCTVSETTGSSFAFGADWEDNFIYNDIEKLKNAYGGTGADIKLNTLNPHSTFAGASASGKDVTLTTVISQGWNDNTDIIVQ